MSHMYIRTSCAVTLIAIEMLEVRPPGFPHDKIENWLQHTQIMCAKHVRVHVVTLLLTSLSSSFSVVGLALLSLPAMDWTE